MEYYLIESITKVIKENNFEILNITEIREERKGNVIDWINIIAKKVLY